MFSPAASVDVKRTKGKGEAGLGRTICFLELLLVWYQMAVNDVK